MEIIEIGLAQIPTSGLNRLIKWIDDGGKLLFNGCIKDSIEDLL